MLTRLLYPLGRLLQWWLAMTLLLLAWWLQQQLLTAYTDAWLAGGGALLLVSGKSLAILYTTTSTGNHPSTSARPLDWLRRLLLTLAWLGSVSVIARYLERAGPGHVWLLDGVIFHTTRYPAYPPYSIILLGCAALLALLLELAQVVSLQRLAQAYLPLWQINRITASAVTSTASRPVTNWTWPGSTNRPGANSFKPSVSGWNSNCIRPRAPPPTSLPSEAPRRRCAVIGTVSPTCRE